MPFKGTLGRDKEREREGEMFPFEHLRLLRVDRCPRAGGLIGRRSFLSFAFEREHAGACVTLANFLFDHQPGNLATCGSDRAGSGSGTILAHLGRATAGARALPTDSASSCVEINFALR